MSNKKIRNYLKTNLIIFSFLKKNLSTQQIHKVHPFTDEQVRNKAYQLWELRGNASSSEENWNDAIQELAREQRFKKALRPLRRLWWWTGLGRPTQCIWKWTGFQEKKGWDFLQLLIAPILIAGIGLGFQESVKQRDTQQQKADRLRDIQQQNADQEKEKLIVEDKVNQDTLTKYLVEMENLLKDGLLKINMSSHNSYESYKSDKFIIAQIKTVLAIQSLDRNRQQIVIQFLEASGFNNSSIRTNPLDPKKWGETDRVLLYKAPMRKANLVASNLSGAVLIGVFFNAANLGCTTTGQCSNLTRCDLRGAHLHDAILRGANLRHTDFREADLLKTDIKDADINDANFSGAESLTIAQVKSAKNWEQAHFSPKFRQKLGLPPEPKETGSSLLDRLN